VQIVPPDPSRYVGLTFSPSGDYVYFTRFETRLVSNVYRIPVLGGTPQLVISDVDGPISFSPDGSRFAFIQGNTSRNEVSVLVAPADGSSEPRRLATRPMVGGYTLFTRAAWSPDGKTIAVAVGGQTWIGSGIAGDVVIVGFDVASGRERPIVTGRWDSIANLDWLSNGSLIVSGAELGHSNNQLWRVSLDGTIRRVTHDLNTYSDVAGAAKAPVIVTVLGDLSSTISAWAADDSSLTPVTSGPGRYDGQEGMVWTPDGHLIFTSGVGGQSDLWLIDAHGSNAHQLTANAGTPRMVDVTPDGNSTLFVAVRDGQPGIWRLTFADNKIARLTDGIHDVFPLCLPDNRSFLFTRFEPTPHLYRESFGGKPEQIPDLNTLAVAASRDGRTVATLSVEKKPEAIDAVPLDGHQDTRRYDILNAPVMVTWTPSNDGLTFLESRSGPPSLWNQPISGGPPRELLNLHGERIFSFAWSQDGHLAIARGPVPTDVVLISMN
jgi:Tol biopolymer transport system component